MAYACTLLMRFDRFLKPWLYGCQLKLTSMRDAMSWHMAIWRFLLAW
jgi:hypothetical protein